VLLALNKVDNPRERYQHEVAQRAIEWEFAMQCKNGGWGSFDKDNTKMIFQYIPFADHNAMLDPPTVDITGRILEMLATYGYTRDDSRVQKAIKFIRSEQEPDGSWFGRWGVNYIYGTFLVLRVGRDWVRPQRAGGSAGGGVDQDGAESGWWVGRNVRQLRRSEYARSGP
jgi:squalene-hopene/tetraprenyl-beta-curcumene cyclase